MPRSPQRAALITEPPQHPAAEAPVSDCSIPTLPLGNLTEDPAWALSVQFRALLRKGGLYDFRARIQTPLSQGGERRERWSPCIEAVISGREFCGTRWGGPRCGQLTSWVAWTLAANPHGFSSHLPQAGQGAPARSFPAWVSFQSRRHQCCSSPWWRHRAQQLQLSSSCSPGPIRASPAPWLPLS